VPAGYNPITGRPYNYVPPPPAPGGVVTPPKLPGTPGSAFHHYGNWGGPGWANGGWNPEDGFLPLPGDPRYKAPVDKRDACYEGHDRCINGCPKCPIKENAECIQACDYKLAACLRSAGYRGLESWSFDTWIPGIIHATPPPPPDKNVNPWGFSPMPPAGF
jgi:hypothetical protein